MSDRQRRAFFENVFLKYGKDIQKFIFLLACKNQHLMEEIYRNTMEAAYKDIKLSEDECEIKRWLCTIAKAETGRYYTIHGNDYDCYKEFEDMDDEMDALDEEEDRLPYIADFDVVKQAIKGFSAETQQIFLLHYYYDMPLEEISEILHVKYNIIRSIHKRGLDLMESYPKEKWSTQ